MEPASADNIMAELEADIQDDIDFNSIIDVNGPVEQQMSDSPCPTVEGNWPIVDDDLDDTRNEDPKQPIAADHSLPLVCSSLDNSLAGCDPSPENTSGSPESAQPPPHPSSHEQANLDEVGHAFSRSRAPSPEPFRRIESRVTACGHGSPVTGPALTRIHKRRKNQQRTKGERRRDMRSTDREYLPTTLTKRIDHTKWGGRWRS